jgi:hypothetical protein
LGAGLPLQQLDNVQLAFLTNVLPGYALSSNFAIGSTAPAAITKSRIFGQSPAMFPRPQITYSTISMWGELSSCTNASINPLEIKT